MPSPLFQFSPYENGSIGSMVALMMAPARARAEALRTGGEAQARAAQASGNAWAGAAGTIGALAAGIPGQMEAQKDAAQVRAVREKQITGLDQQNELGAQQVARGRQASQFSTDLADVLKGTARRDENGAKLYDVDAIAAELQKRGHGEAAINAAKELEGLNAGVRQSAAARQALVQLGAQAVQRGGNDPALALAFLDNLEENSLLPGDTVGQYRDFIAQGGPEAVAKLTAALGGPQADPKTREVKTRNADGSETVQIVADTPGQTFQSAAPVPQPKEYQVTVPGPDGQPMSRLATEDELRRGVRTYRAPTAAATPQGGGLDDDGLELAATRFRLTGQYPSRDSKQNAQITNAAAKQNKLIGNTPAAAIQKQAAYKADTSALQQVTKMRSSAESFEAKARGQIDIISELSGKVARFDSPMLNNWYLAGREHVEGDSATHQLFNAIETFSAEYAKIMEGSTGSAAGSSDSARAAAKRLVNASQGKKSLTDTLGLMAREMELTLRGYDETIDHINGRLGGGSAAPAAPVGGPVEGAVQAIPNIPGGEATFKGGRWIRTK